MSETNKNFLNTFKKLFTNIQTIYISLVSIMIIVSNCRNSFREFFPSQKTYAIHFIVGIILTIIAILIIVAHFKFKKYVNFLQILWWVPQLLEITTCLFMPDYKSFTQYCLYYFAYPFSMSIQIGRDIAVYEKLFIKLNLIPLIAIVVTKFVKSR